MSPILSLALLTLVAALGHAQEDRRPELPRPTFSNSFCLFPIYEQWHAGNDGDVQRLREVAASLREKLGPERLYARLGVAVISAGGEDGAYALARELGIGLVLQGGNIEHHSMAWGFDKLLNDPERGDRRFCQWFQDGSYLAGDKPDFTFAIRACSSCYAKPVFELRRDDDMARAKRIAEAVAKYPDTVVACSGPIECEMHHTEDLFGDYSPFTIAEFRDYLTHRGIYAAGAERAGLGYPGGARFSDDPSPAQAAGDHPSFNEVFGTRFTTWSLRYWDPERFPERLPLEADGLPVAGERGHIEGGFDAPRVWPGETPVGSLVAEGNALYWDTWAGVDDKLPGFRSKLLNFWIRDHVGWLSEAGVPKESIFSHQIPGESYGYGRLSRGASAVWTADTPQGSIGITTYFGAASDTDVFEKIIARNLNWGIFEYHPHPINCQDATVDECLLSLGTCLRFRAHILTPIGWGSSAESKDFVVDRGPFLEAMRRTMAQLPDQPYYNRGYVDYAPPAVSGVVKKTAGDETRLTWSERIWPDLRYRWPEWEEFDHFEVRSNEGRLLADTRGCEAKIAGSGEGVTVVAVKQPKPPQLPVVSGLKAGKGTLRWDESWSFYCDHYQVDVYDGPEARRPLQTVTKRRARLELRPPGELQEVWCRVAVATGDGQLGPFSEPIAVPLPRPGRTIARLRALPLQAANSPSTLWQDFAVGGISQMGLYQHPPLQGGGWASAPYAVDLPILAEGQKLLFLSELGIRDGAEQSNGVRFRLEVNEATLLDEVVKPDGRWHPVEVDLEKLAGQRVRLTLMTNDAGHSAADWAGWADPTVLLVGPGVRELPMVTGIVALGKEVRGKVTLKWLDTASDGTIWSSLKPSPGFAIYRGADRDFATGPESLLGYTRSNQFVDETFDGTQTFYRVTARFADGTESPPSEAVQYAP